MKLTSFILLSKLIPGKENIVKDNLIKDKDAVKYEKNTEKEKAK